MGRRQEIGVFCAPARGGNRMKSPPLRCLEASKKGFSTKGTEITKIHFGWCCGTAGATARAKRQKTFSVHLRGSSCAPCYCFFLLRALSRSA
jgi:hypothetical protein